MILKLKNYLDITWEDEGTTQKIDGIAHRALSVIKSYAGELALDIPANSELEQLWLDCCRYLYCNAFNEFEHDYMCKLLALRLNRKSDGYGEDTNV